MSSPTYNGGTNTYKEAERFAWAGSELGKSNLVPKLGHATNVLQSYYQHNTRIINYKKAGMVMDEHARKYCKVKCTIG